MKPIFNFLIAFVCYLPMVPILVKDYKVVPNSFVCLLVILAFIFGAYQIEIGIKKCKS